MTIRNKKKFLYAAVFFSAICLLSGCVNTLKGEYYLNSKEYSQGIEHFEQSIKKHPEVAESYFYLGRLLLAQEKYSKAEFYLKKAVDIEPLNDKHHFWLGLAYGGQKKYQLEVESYKKTTTLNPKNYKAHTYSGHTLLASKKYSEALKSYQKALALTSNIPSALFNSGLILHRQKKYSEANIIFKKYIDDYSSSPKTLDAAKFLNQTGDFGYRIHLINKRNVVAKKVEFEPENLKLLGDSLFSIQYLGSFLKKNPNLILHILAYEKGNKELAKKKAKKIKEYLHNYYRTVEKNQITTSWFDMPEPVEEGKKLFHLDISINFFAVLKDKK